MKTILIGLVFLGSTFPVSALRADEVEKAPLFLGIGEQRVLRLSGLKRYSIGGQCFRVHPVPRDLGRDHLLIKGTLPGVGDLWVWKMDGTAEHRSVKVEKLRASEIPPALERALSRLQETEIVYAGNGVVLRGTLSTLSEAARVANLKKNHPKEVTDETEPTEQLLNQVQQSLEEWVKASRYGKDLRIERIDNDLWIRGNMRSPVEREAVEKQIRRRFPLAHLEIESLPDSARTVHFRVYLLELKRTRFHSFGLGWPAFQEGAFRVTSTGIQNLLQLDATLNILEGDGSARILSKPELVVRAPGEAELFSGGELPIQVRSNYYSNVSWKSFGLTLKLKVAQSTGERVRLDILTEISHLDSTIAMDKVPGVQANRMKTQVDAHYGTPLLLSGLLQQGTRENAKGLPLLRQIPILGSLFGSEDYLNERSELVAILLPSLTPPPAPISRVERFTPRGPVPPPREWISPEEQRRLREAPDYPWNVLQ